MTRFRMPETPDATRAFVGFARLLRERGLRMSPAQVAVLQAAVASLPPADFESLYWAGRACLGVPRELAPAYDAAFAEYFLGTAPARPQPAPDAEAKRNADPESQPGPQDRRGILDVVADADGTGEAGAAPPEVSGAAASAAERLRVTPFAECSAEELKTVTALVRRLRFRPPSRPSRRMVASTHREAVDLRATARRAMRTNTELILPAWRRHQRRPRRLVLLLDVSRSMAVYSRLLLHFAYAAVASGREVEVVCFGTQLTRITPLLRSRRTSQALEVAAMSVLDWNGGTRIASAVDGLRTTRSVRGALRGAVVLICSDGLEQGDPSDLGARMSLLRRTCYQVIWVNPLAGDPRYRPVAGGMRAALPFVDRLVAGDTLAALEDVAAVLSAHPRSRSRPASPAQSHPSHGAGARESRLPTA